MCLRGFSLYFHKDQGFSGDLTPEEGVSKVPFEPPSAGLSVRIGCGENFDYL